MHYFCINFSKIFWRGGIAPSPDPTPYPFTSPLFRISGSATAWQCRGAESNLRPERPQDYKFGMLPLDYQATLAKLACFLINMKQQLSTLVLSAKQCIDELLPALLENSGNRVLWKVVLLNLCHTGRQSHITE